MEPSLRRASARMALVGGAWPPASVAMVTVSGRSLRVRLSMSWVTREVGPCVDSLEATSVCVCVCVCMCVYVCVCVCGKVA